jgi:L-cysteine desulfidase
MSTATIRQDTAGDDSRARGTRVWDLAHTRSGDKGNTSNIAVMAYDEAGWQRIRKDLTSERVMAAFAHLAKGPVTRYELPRLRALNFVIENALAGGVTRSLRLDPHGKTLSSVMLTIELPDAD